MKATAAASANIALIKYWGKRDENEKTPLNTSISLTLDSSFSCTTTVEFSEKANEDSFSLNRKEQRGEALARVKEFLEAVRGMAGISEKARVSSVMNFPAGVGIASSAAGFAALAAASGRAAGLDLSPSELSSLARQGSGSASRSVFGGFVKWSGESAEPLFPESHWPEIVDVVFLITKKKKSISSREGMRMTAETSRAFRKRLGVVEGRARKLEQAIEKRNFERLAELTMEEAEEFLECLRDTKPSLNYLEPLSHEAAKRIRELNKNGIKAAYTFDAGPTAHIITLRENLESVLNALKPLQLTNPGTEVRVSGLGQGARLVSRHIF